MGRNGVHAFACMMPALLKMTSSPPQESSFSTIFCTCSSLETSQTWNIVGQKLSIKGKRGKTYEGLDLCVRGKLLDLLEGGGELLLVDVTHQDIGTLLDEENRRLEADTAGCAGDDAVLALETAHCRKLLVES